MWKRERLEKKLVFPTKSILERFYKKNPVIVYFEPPGIIVYAAYIELSQVIMLMLIVMNNVFQDKGSFTPYQPFHNGLRKQMHTPFMYYYDFHTLYTVLLIYVQNSKSIFF